MVGVPTEYMRRVVTEEWLALATHPLFTSGPFQPKALHFLKQIKGQTTLRRCHFMKYDYDRLIKATRTVAQVNACSISIEEAIRLAQSRVDGTVFEAKLKEIDQQIVWKVKLLVAGQRVKVYIDARSGLVINAKAEVSFNKPSDRIPQQVVNANPTVSFEIGIR